MTTIQRNALVVEDEPMVASLISVALEATGFNTKVANDFKSAIAEIKSFDPDVVIIDISLGDGPNGLDLARHVRTKHPDIGVLILTKHPDTRSIDAESGIPEGCGFLRKESVGQKDMLMQAIEMVLSDRATQVREDLDPNRPLANLSAKQVATLRMLAQGYTNLEIAARMGLSNSAIEQRLIVIFKTLGIADIEGVNPRAEAIRVFVSHAGLPARD